MTHPPVFTYTFTIPESVIDENDHVNNVAYVQWMQDVVIRVGEAVGYKKPENTGWFVREHRIEYLTPAVLGDEIEVRTWITEWKRVRAQRRYEFIRKADGKAIARGETQWVFVELPTGRPIPVPAEVQALFPVVAEQSGSAASAG